MTNGYFTLAALLFLIVAARIMDVSMGTLRVVFISRGRKRLAAVCGFFEVFIWIVAISQVLSGVQHWLAYFAYAGGYAIGTLVGMWLEEKLAIGWVVVRLITNRPATGLLEQLSQAGFGATLVPAQGSQGPVQIVFMMVRRNRVPALRALLAQFDSAAFFTIEDLRDVREDWPSLAVARTSAGKLPMS